VRVKWFTQEVK